MQQRSDQNRPTGRSPREPAICSPGPGAQATVDMMGLVTTGAVPQVQPQPDWTVVASCWTDAPAPNGSTDRLPRIMLGTVPANYAIADVVGKARQGAYKGQIDECRGQTPDTFTVAAS